MIASMHFGRSIARRLRRHWAFVAVGALFLLAGALALDDYIPAQVDMGPQRLIGNAALDYLAGDGERAFGQLHHPSDRYYGAAFEAPLALVERLLGLEDSRDWDVYRVRFLLTHLFFLAGAGVCYLLALRLFGSRALALVAMALFLLHPRLYAHSFINSKDVPFFAAFMVSLYLVHRAFRRETLGAFLLCGAGIGLLVNLRVMGLALFAVVLALRALDAAFARGREECGRALLTGGAFALAAMLAYYASLPVLWTDPVGRFAELVETFSSHPVALLSLFQGDYLYSPDGPPFDYVPVWAGITTPPAVLLLALAGAAALAWRGLRRPRDVLRNGPLRFGLVLIALPLATAVAVVALENNVYNGWRQLYFLYAPALLLAVTGLQWLAAAPRGQWMRAGAYVLTGAAIAVTVVSMVRIHPHQESYFNALTDRTTPERLASRYKVILRGRSLRSGIVSVLNAHPSGSIFHSHPFPYTLHPEHRERLIHTQDFRSGEGRFLWLSPIIGWCPAGPHVVRLYANTLHCLTDPAAYFGEALTTEPVVRARYDIHRDGRRLTWVRDGCPADEVGRFGAFFLHVHPRDAGDLPAPRAEQGHDFDNLNQALRAGAFRIDGNCVAVALLPEYPIASVHTGQIGLWSAEVPPDYAGARREALTGEPLARGAFDIYQAGRTLTYVRDGCTEEEAAAPFFLHLYPLDAGDLPDDRREHGFNGLDAALTNNAGRVGGNCVAFVDLPDYPIASIRTGQFDESGQLWAVEFAPAGRGAGRGDAADYAGARREALATEPLARGEFAIHGEGRTLTYVRDGCTEEEAAAPFFLHLWPTDANDLPDDRREHGFDNLDSALARNAGRAGGNCVAVVDLPDYPIASIRTGQYDASGERWAVEFAPPDGE